MNQQELADAADVGRHTIKSRAIRNGWKPTAADELRRLAAKIGGMATKPSLKAFHNPEDRYKSWGG